MVVLIWVLIFFIRYELDHDRFALGGIALVALIAATVALVKEMLV